MCQHVALLRDGQIEMVTDEALSNVASTGPQQPERVAS